MWNDKSHALLVDPGNNQNNRLLKHIEELGLTVEAILITHGHYDHIEALEEMLKAFPDATVYISEDEIDVLSDPRYNLSFYGVGYTQKELNYIPNKLVKLADEEVFKTCGYSIIMIKTPFHTKGSACYLIANEGVLFSGDTLFKSSIGRTDLPSGSQRTIDESLSKLLSLDDETKVYPGHGDITTMGREKKYNIYLNNLSK